MWLMRDNAEAGSRKLGLPGAISMVIASMIGVGVFTTSGFLAADLGSRPLIILAWLCGGVIAMLGALTYASLARSIPGSGGEYRYLSALIHPLAGFLGGWVSLIVGFSAPLAAAAILFGKYIHEFFPQISSGFSATLILAAFLLIQLGGFHIATGVHKIIVLLKLVMIGAFFLLMASRLPELPAHTGEPFNAGSFSVSLYWIFLSYSGWNAAVYMSHEIHEPERNVGRALIIGTAVVTILYLGLNYVFIHAVPLEKISGEALVASIAAEALGGKPFADLVGVIICGGLLTSISAMMFLGPRVYGKMAQDGLFPAFISGTEPPFRRGTIFQTSIALIMTWNATYDALLGYIGFLLGISSALCAVGLVYRWVRDKPQDARPATPFPYIPLIFAAIILAQVIFSLSQKPPVIFWGAMTLVAGLPLYFFQSRPASRQTE